MHRLRPLIHLITDLSFAHALELLGLLLVISALGLVITRLSVAAVLSLAVVSEMFSGNWKHVGIPIPYDRVLFCLGLLMLAARGMNRISPTRRFLLSPIHLVMVAVITYAFLSAWGAGTLSGSIGFYALLDRLGVIPFLMFALAPLVFGSERARSTLLVALVLTGLYLGVTACCEGIGLKQLVIPRYITDPSVGIHFGRARGPFTESVADGLTMFMCGTAAVVALSQWRSKSARILCIITTVLCVAGILFTLTRAVWIGSVVGLVGAALFDRRLRRRLPALLGTAAVIVGLLFIFVPGLGSKASSRTSQESPVWDRYNTNKAALRAWEDHPVFGIGWETFITKGPDYLRQAGTYPMTGAGLEVHNVFLSHLVELGAIGALLWCAALVGGVGRAALTRGPPHLYPWRLGLIAVFIQYLVCANTGPLSYPLPNLLLWLWAGIVAADRYVTWRHPPGSVMSQSDEQRVSDLVPI